MFKFGDWEIRNALVKVLIAYARKCDAEVIKLAAETKCYEDRGKI